MNKIAGIDEETMRDCPQRDQDNARAIGEIMLCSFLYIAALFALIGHQFFAGHGQIRPEILIASMFIATFILLIDSYMIMRSGWHANGIQELKRGGLDVSGGPAARVKAWIFLAIRILLSIGLAQLTAIFVGLLIFGADIRARIDKTYRDANGSLIDDATKRVDDGIRHATDAVTAQSARVAGLSGQVQALRQNEVADPQIQRAEQEVMQLAARKAKADDDVRDAEDFATREAAGIKRGGNSGQPGCRARCRAAREQVTNARAREQAAGNELGAARARLDAFRAQTPAGNQATRQQRVHDQRSDFEKALDAENARLASLKEELRNLTSNREVAIRHAVEDAPDYVGRGNGLLTQIRVLEEIAREDVKIALLIGLINFVSFAFELAAVLAKVTNHVPTTYAALLARDAYLRPVRIVDEMMKKSKATGSQDGNEAPPPGSSSDEERGSGTPATADLLGGTADSPAPPRPKRGRGRPRKPRPLDGSEPPVGEKIEKSEEACEGQHEVGDLPGPTAGFKSH